jgi:hypothetical protein
VFYRYEKLKEAKSISPDIIGAVIKVKSASKQIRRAQIKITSLFRK